MTPAVLRGCFVGLTALRTKPILISQPTGFCAAIRRVSFHSLGSFSCSFLDSSKILGLFSQGLSLSSPFWATYKTLTAGTLCGLKRFVFAHTNPGTRPREVETFT